MKTIVFAVAVSLLSMSPAIAGENYVDNSERLTWDQYLTMKLALFPNNF